MKISYEGIGQWAATFACSGAAEGEMVKISGNGAVGACGAGDDFCGQVLSVSRDGGACAVVLGGMVTAGYSGDAPALGWNSLAADGDGGVEAVSGGQTESESAQSAAAGRGYLVVDVDTSGKTVTFVL